MNVNFKYNHFTATEVKPKGWIKEQLKIQAAGLSGNLDKFWPDIQRSEWIGGDREGWERVPYWLDGFIPLAYLLEDKDLKTRAKKYIDAILERQQEDGWICPCTPERRGHYDTWATLLICKVLVVYYECSKDERAMVAAERAMKNFKDHLREHTLFGWGQSRWYEGLITIFALYKRKPEKWLVELAITLATQGLDYKRLFTYWQDQEFRRSWTQQTHIVNLMMALKSEALFSAISNEDPNSFAHIMWEMLEQYHGSPVGFINGDECLGGPEAIHGTELCGIAETMYSFEILFEITGDTYWMEKAEEFAFNFLPATISDDMWSHQYLQMTNQIACCKQNTPPVFGTNGEESHCFGLEPNYGCCTANFNQAWPKYVISAFYQTAEGIVSSTPIPTELSFTRNGVEVSVEVETNYPFEDTAIYKVKTATPVEFALEIRIPKCASAVLGGKSVEPGSIVTLKRVWDNDEVKLELTQEFSFKSCNHDMVCLKRGPLFFAAPISEDRQIVEYERDGVERKFPYCDYNILPTEEWGLAFTDAEFKLHVEGIQDYPFSRKNPPMMVETKMAVIHWGTEENQPNVCRATPLERTPIKVIDKKLVPYGATTLRMTAMPKIK